MGCIYMDNSLDEEGGKCTMWDGNIEMNGCDEIGYCVCSDDPDPNVMCDAYESDYVCSECGADLNIERCDCE